MTREEKIKKIVYKCRITSDCRECKLYGYYSVCPVQQYLKDGATITNWGVDKVYEILFENEEIKEEKEKKKMTVEELVQVLDKKSFFKVKEPHKKNCIYQSIDGTNWEKIKERNVMQVNHDIDGFIIYVAPPTEK